MTNLILDGPLQFTFLMGVLTTGLALVVLTNRLFDRVADGKADAREKPVRRGLLTILMLQLLIAITLTVRILLSAKGIASATFDFIIVGMFLTSLLAWAVVFVSSYTKFLPWGWFAGVLAAGAVLSFLFA